MPLGPNSGSSLNPPNTFLIILWNFFALRRGDRTMGSYFGDILRLLGGALVLLCVCEGIFTAQWRL